MALSTALGNRWGFWLVTGRGLNYLCFRKEMEAIILGLGLVGEGSNREVVRIKCIVFTFYQFALNSGFIFLRVFQFFLWETMPTSVT